MRYQVIAFDGCGIWDYYEYETRAVARVDRDFHSESRERGVVYDFTQLLGAVRFIDRPLFSKIKIWDREKRRFIS